MEYFKNNKWFFWKFKLSTNDKNFNYLIMRLFSKLSIQAIMNAIFSKKINK